jgi:hypothetical protein
MAAGALFSLMILVLVVVQTVLQAKILKELRRLAQNSVPDASS